jgi:glutaminase
MLTCGTYDAAGDFVYRVGLPAKSGVGGGIVAVLPGEFAVCVWSPGLDATGNSLVGSLALEWLTTRTGRSIF